MRFVGGIVFDIETCSAVTEDDVPGFDATEVKTGNIKDPDKIAAKIDEARRNHAREFIEKASLSAAHGRTLAIGYHSIDKAKDSIGTADTPDREPDLIGKFWQFAASKLDAGCPMIGVNIHGFDLPFLIRRSWILGVDVPTIIRQGRYWNPLLIDLADAWRLGDRIGTVPSNFNDLARAFGTAGKPDGMNGADFAKLYLLGGQDRQQAINYLLEDIRQPAQWAKRMGIALAS